MPTRILLAVMFVALAAETTYIATRHPPDRFKMVGDTEGLVPYDSVTGQLCRSFKPWESPAVTSTTPGDTFAEVVARTPTCTDIR